MAAILAAPDSYEGKRVIVRGTAAQMTRAAFPNGRPYYTVCVEDEGAGLIVFFWDRPPVEEGDQVEAVGIFHVWRYNLHHMLENARLTPRSSGARPRAGGQSPPSSEKCGGGRSAAGESGR